MSLCFSFWLPGPQLITWSSSPFSSSSGLSCVLARSQAHSFGLTHSLSRRPSNHLQGLFLDPTQEALPAGLGKGAQDVNESLVFAKLNKRMSSWETGDVSFLLLHVHESYLNTHFSSCGLLGPYKYSLPCSGLA